MHPQRPLSSFPSSDASSFLALIFQGNTGRPNFLRSWQWAKLYMTKAKPTEANESNMQHNEYVAVPCALMSDKHAKECFEFIPVTSSSVPVFMSRKSGFPAFSSNLDTESRLGLSSMLAMTKICKKYCRQNTLFLAFRASHEGCLLTRVPVCRSKLGKNWVVCMLTSSRVAWLPSFDTFVGPYNGTSSVNCWAVSVLNCNSGGTPRLAKPRQQHFGSWREVGLGEDSWDAHRKNVNSCLASCD